MVRVETPRTITGKRIKRDGVHDIQLEEQRFIRGTLSKLMNSTMCGWVIEPCDRLSMFAWMSMGTPMSEPFCIFTPKHLETTWFSIDYTRRWLSKVYPHSNTFLYVPQTVDGLQNNPSFKELQKFAKKKAGLA